MFIYPFNVSLLHDIYFVLPALGVAGKTII